MGSKSVFVSHAAKDKPLADKLVDLIQTGGGVNADDIFCTSLEGLGVPTGKNFISYIREEIQTPKVVVLLLTPNYLASHFCLAELGASWAMSHQALPLLVPPLKYDDVKGVLLGIHVSRLDNDSGLDEFFEELTKALGINPNHARLNAKVKQFLQGLPPVLESLPKLDHISSEKFKQVEERLNESTLALDQAEEENSSLRQLVADLEGCKDAEQVAHVRRMSMKAYDQLKEELESFKQIVSKLPNVVVYVLYRELMKQTTKFNAFENREADSDAGQAVDEGYLFFEESAGSFSLNRADPKVKKALAAGKKLAKYLDESVDDCVASEFEDEHEYQLSLDNVRLWKDYFCERMSRYS